MAPDPEIRTVAKFTFANGETSMLIPGPGVELSGETLMAIGLVCIKPQPISAEVIEVPVSQA